MPGEGEPWEELEYRELFEVFPLDGRAPHGEGARIVAKRIGRTVGAVEAQWNDARTYCQGLDSSIASEQLRSYLDRNCLCPR